MTYIAQVSFVTAFEFHNHASGVLYFSQCFANFGPISVTLAEVHPFVSIFFPLEIFDMQFDDARAQSANPILRIAVEQYVADIKPRFNPRAITLKHNSASP